MTLRGLMLIGFVLLFSGCVGKTGFNDFRVKMGFISPYEAAFEEFKKGEVMEARSRLVSIKKDDKDYKKSRKFLNNKVEPARLKLLRYYAKKGKSEEAKKHWAQAEEAYKTAAALSRSPKALLRYQRAMNIKVRQLRAESMYGLRLEEDKVWLGWQDHYTPPYGLFGDDKAFEIARSKMTKNLDSYVSETWQLAEKFKSLNMPEIAWVYADSYLRFQADSKKAKDLKQAMKKEIPKGINISKVSKTRKIKVPKRSKTYPKVHAKITANQVKSLMKKSDWVRADEAAQSLRRQGDPKADALLETIAKKRSMLAAKAYEKGNIAFRMEHIEQAVSWWEEAVKWMPKEQIYADSLRRGLKIQERLSALKREESPAEKDRKVEE